MNNMPTNDKKDPNYKKIPTKPSNDAVIPRKKKDITPTFSTKDGINTDPFGSWTGVSTDDPYEKPIQDADDL